MDLLTPFITWAQDIGGPVLLPTIGIFCAWIVEEFFA